MFKHILVPTDGSPFSNGAAKCAIRLAKSLQARVTALIVVPPTQGVTYGDGFVMPSIPALRKRIEAEAKARAAAILGAIEKAAAKSGVKCSTVVAMGDRPYEVIIQQARKSRCDAIVMSSHGCKGLQALLLGSETQKVLTHSKLPVLVCRK